MLRRRNPNPAYASTARVPLTATSKAKGARRGRVALADTMPQLRTAGPACTDVADQEAAQAGVGQAQWRGEPQPADDPNGAQESVNAESKPHHADPEGSHSPCAHAGTDQTGTASPGPEEARDAGKTSARCRNGREQQRQPQLKHEAGGASGRTRSACADLSNKAVPYSSSDNLPGGVGHAFGTATRLCCVKPISLKAQCFMLSTIPLIALSQGIMRTGHIVSATSPRAMCLPYGDICT